MFNLDLDATLTLLMTYSHIQKGIAKLKLVNYLFFLDDLDLDPMTLIPKLDLEMVKVYIQTETCTDRDTDRHY